MTFEAPDSSVQIMTAEDYIKIEHSRPYTFIYRVGDSILYYYGEGTSKGHSYDPEDKQWEIEKNFWSGFLRDTEGKKRIVLVEGGKAPIEQTEQEAISKYGGVGLVTFLAAQNGIDTYSPEPEARHEVIELEKNFSKECI